MTGFSKKQKFTIRVKNVWFRIHLGRVYKMRMGSETPRNEWGGLDYDIFGT